MSEGKVVQLHGADDASLVVRARAGDRGAFGQLFERHVRAVVRLLSRILGHDADVPDLANEVLLLAWQRLDEVDDEARFGAFLSGVCVNVARNRLRSRRRRKWLVFGAPEADVPVAESTDAREALGATFAVLKTMEEHLRICFSLRYLDGRELTEVAELMNVSLATIKRWLQRADGVFLEKARGHRALQPWLDAGSRWGGVA